MLLLLIKQIYKLVLKLTQEIKHISEMKSQLSMEVHNRTSKIDKLKKRYEIITLQMQAPEGETEYSQVHSYFVVIKNFITISSLKYIYYFQYLMTLRIKYNFRFK